MCIYTDKGNEMGSRHIFIEPEKPYILCPKSIDLPVE